MLEYVGHTGGVHRHRAQSDEEYILFIVGGKVNMLCAGNPVAIFLVADIKGRYLLLAQKLKRWVMDHRDCCSVIWKN